MRTIYTASSIDKDTEQRLLEIHVSAAEKNTIII